MLSLGTALAFDPRTPDPSQSRTPLLRGSMDRRDARPDARQRFRRTLVRVLTIQVIALALLWILQARYAG